MKVINEIKINGMDITFISETGVCPVMKVEKNGVTEIYEGMDFTPAEISAAGEKINYQDNTRAYNEMHEKAFTKMDEKWITWATWIVFYGEPSPFGLPEQELPVEKA